MLQVRWATVVAAVTGTAGNTLLISIYLLCMYRFPKRTLNILSLMVCDLTNSALTITLHTISRDRLLTKGVNVIAPIALALRIGSIFHINSIVVTRLIACAKPFCYKRWVTRRRVLCTVISAWAISSILLLQILLNSTTTQDAEPEYPLDVLATNSKLVISCQAALMVALTLVLLTMIRHIAVQISNYKKRDCNLRLRKSSSNDLRKTTNVSLSPHRGGRSNMVSTSTEIINKSDLAVNSIPRKDFILTRHIYIIVWSVTLLVLYHVMFISPIIYVAVRGQLNSPHRVFFREFCVLSGTFGTLVNSTMFAVPLIKGKIHFSLNKIA